LPFTYTPDVRKKRFLFSDAWAIAEAYVGFCVGFTNTPDPAFFGFNKLLWLIFVFAYFQNFTEKKET
jgi:hypothetical protein